ncbi:MAG: MFS transporter [Terriglobia bacterium]
MSATIRQLDEQRALTRHQNTIVLLAGIHGMLEFYDQFIIAFVLVLVVKPWRLTFGESAAVLFSSGIGSIIGSFLWGYIADRYGRRPTLVAIILSYSFASLLLAFTPAGNWIYFTILRVGVGLGVGGYVVNMALVQEFAPAQKRGWTSGIISVCAPVGLLLSSAFAAYLTPFIGWRGLFVLGAAPALFAVVILLYIPESPRWALEHGQVDVARKATAWALEMPISALDIKTVEEVRAAKSKWTDIFSYRRSVATGFLLNLGVVTGVYGLLLWSPTLLVMVQRVSPETAAKIMIAISLANIFARILFSYLSEKIGRRASGAIYCFGGAILLAFTGGVAHGDIGLGSFFWLFLLFTSFLTDGGFAISGPYTTEIWPSRLRTSGAGFSYGAGSIGKITGPLGLALVIGSSNYISPEATTAKIVPAFLYLAAWYILAGLTYVFIGFETKGRSLEEIDQALERGSGKARRDA